ncbi:hypothetical protein CPB84DRAFT_1541490 [Gymnopilus junonius]|uniref:Uncharacterized protein n=1 Tax=Gymnopilus junonius TaxID=109634 RepID=A0A9P5TJ12_GYMJU|nr:hypothetical protein CPB84DRAFT_1541490 [Gymnopilus junonius]
MVKPNSEYLDGHLFGSKIGTKKGSSAFSLHPPTLTNAVANLDFSTLPDRIRAIDRVLGNKEGRPDYIPQMLPIEKGTATHVYAAFDPGLSAHNGSYLLDCHVADPLSIRSSHGPPVLSRRRSCGG